MSESENPFIGRGEEDGGARINYTDRHDKIRVYAGSYWTTIEDLDDAEEFLEAVEETVGRMRDANE